MIYVSVGVWFTGWLGCIVRYTNRGRLSLPRIRLCERFNRESSWLARNLPGWISRLNFVPRDLRRIASGASHRDIAEVLVGEAPSTPVPRRLLRPYADCPECTCSSEKAPQPAPCVSGEQFLVAGRENPFARSIWLRTALRARTGSRAGSVPRTRSAISSTLALSAQASRMRR